MRWTYEHDIEAKEIKKDIREIFNIKTRDRLFKMLNNAVVKENVNLLKRVARECYKVLKQERESGLDEYVGLTRVTPLRKVVIPPPNPIGDVEPVTMKLAVFKAPESDRVIEDVPPIEKEIAKFELPSSKVKKTTSRRH